MATGPYNDVQSVQRAVRAVKRNLLVADDLEGFPRRLDLLMKAEGLSTRQLSERTKKRVSHSAIAQWISGENKASLDQVRFVAEVFGWDPIELLHGRAGPDTVDRLADLDAAMRRVRRALLKAADAAGLIEGTMVVDLNDDDRKRGTG